MSGDHDDGGDLIHVVFTNPKAVVGRGPDLIACEKCRNRTYRIEDHPDSGGRVYCAACNTYIGQIAWMLSEEEPDDAPNDPATG